jgi:hypothetical protein
MTDSSQVLSELRAEFVERNTALFLLLGLLSTTKRFNELLASQRSAAPAMGAAVSDELTRFHYLLLGLHAFGAKLSSFAEQGKRAASPPRDPLLQVAPRGLLR